jgi:hypothetical protein
MVVLTKVNKIGYSEKQEADCGDHGNHRNVSAKKSNFFLAQSILYDLILIGIPLGDTVST